jgi:hypothetical protein
VKGHTVGPHGICNNILTLQLNQKGGMAHPGQGWRRPVSLKEGFVGLYARHLVGIILQPLLAHSFLSPPVELLIGIMRFNPIQIRKSFFAQTFVPPCSF